MIDDAPGGVVLTVRVIPRAGKAGLAGTRGDALLVRVNAPPLDGAANDELVETIARALGVPRRTVSIVSGDRSRSKRVLVTGLAAAAAAARLAPKA